MHERERLLTIPALQLIGYLEDLDSEQFKLYIGNISAFIDGFPEKEKTLKTLLEAKDYTALFEQFIAIHDLLSAIRAEELATASTKLAGIFTKESHEKGEAVLIAFLAAVTTLSIDLQMIIFQKEKTDEPQSASLDDSGHPKTILAVDDSAFFLNMLKTYLHDTEYKLICVNSGMMALRYLKEHTPDLLIFDIEMPVMDGYELIKQVRDRGIKVPVLFLTGNAAKECVLKAIKAGGSDFITKPIDKAHVLERIKKFI